MPLLVSQALRGQAPQKSLLMRRYSTSIRIWLAATVAAMMISACAGPPVQEMSDARQAIEAAEQAGAEGSAPAQIHRAQSLIRDAEFKLQKKAYNGARKDARMAKDKAVEALGIAREKGSQP
jgi:hypothetical protein